MGFPFSNFGGSGIIFLIFFFIIFCCLCGGFKF